MTSKDLTDEKYQGNRKQADYQLDSEPRIETTSAGIGGEGQVVSISGSTTGGLPAKSNGLKPKTHGGVIRQLIEQGKAQLAEDEAAIQAINKRMKRTKQGLGNLESLLTDWEQVTEPLRDDQLLLPSSSGDMPE
jgi:hypothetical protein